MKLNPKKSKLVEVFSLFLASRDIVVSFDLCLKGLFGLSSANKLSIDRDSPRFSPGANDFLGGAVVLVSLGCLLW